MIGLTGSTGVLGKIIVSKLEKSKIDFTVFDEDITNQKSVLDWFEKNDITYIIHLASKVAVKDVEENLSKAYDVNITGTINLIKAISKKNKKIVFFYASSSHVYKSSDKDIKETDIILPINSYGLTKHISEMILLDFQKNYKKINLCIGRIFSFYHQTQKPPFLYPNLLKRFDEENLEMPFKLYGANSTRDFLIADDVCDIILKLVNLEYNGIINIASGRSIKIMDFVQSIAPKKIIFDFDENEKTNHLNADVSLLNKILKNVK